ncbi:MAG: acyltransferase [Tyzzerella sp.]|nr:acyltransferase [Tyzzerella sp.]
MKKRIYYFDILRVIAMFMVLLNHTIASNITNSNCSGGEAILCSITMVMSRLGVPIFLMLSGALNLKKGNKVCLKTLYTKRIIRLLVPFVIWSFIYFVLYDIIRDGNMTATGLFSLLFRPGNAGHLWYMYVIIALFLVLPVFQAIIDKLEKSQIEYILFVWIISSGILHWMKELEIIHIDFYIDLHILNGLWGYFLIGWYLTEFDFNLPKKRIIILASLLFMVLSGMLCYQKISMQTFSDSIVSYSGVPIILLSVCVFMLVKIRGDITIGWVQKSIEYLSKISFCIYLNQFLARAVASVLIGKILSQGIWAMLLEFLITTGISVVFATIIYHLPDNLFGRVIKSSLGIGDK